MHTILGPDVYVNASVALGSAPEVVARRILSKQGQGKATSWILERVQSMLSALPEFKDDAVEQQMKTIRSLVDVIQDRNAHSPDSWEAALVSAARLASLSRVITDHPDLLAKGEVEGVEFVSTEAWLLEQSIPPPPPPSGGKK